MGKGHESDRIGYTCFLVSVWELRGISCGSYEELPSFNEIRSVLYEIS